VSRWPPVVWPLMSLASLFLLMGMSSWDTTALVLGIAFALIGFALALFVAHRRFRDRRTLRRALLALALFYAINAALAGLADPVYALVALGAALFPEAALALTLAFVDVVSDAGDAPR
jgi:hypothetical protein